MKIEQHGLPFLIQLARCDNLSEYSCLLIAAFPPRPPHAALTEDWGKLESKDHTCIVLQELLSRYPVCLGQP